MLPRSATRSLVFGNFEIRTALKKAGLRSEAGSMWYIDFRFGTVEGIVHLHRERALSGSGRRRGGCEGLTGPKGTETEGFRA